MIFIIKNKKQYDIIIFKFNYKMKVVIIYMIYILPIVLYLKKINLMFFSLMDRCKKLMCVYQEIKNFIFFNNYVFLY